MSQCPIGGEILRYRAFGFIIAAMPSVLFTPLPGAVPPIHGVTAWRGDLLTLLELRSTLGLAVNALHDLARVIVLGMKGYRPFGILADAVHSIVSVDLQTLHPLPEGSGNHRQYLRGVTTDGAESADSTESISNCATLRTTYTYRRPNSYRVSRNEGDGVGPSSASGDFSVAFARSAGISAPGSSSPRYTR